MSNQNLIPPGVTHWKVSPVEIDNVPIVLLTLSAQNNKITIPWPYDVSPMSSLLP